MKRNLKKYAILLSMLLLLGCLSGCRNREEIKNELNIAFTVSPSTIDSALVSDTTSGDATSPFLSTLYVYDADRKLVPGLAESYTNSEDGLTFTFKLRDNLVWSDGRKLTAGDFVYGLQRLADPEVGSNAVYFITECCEIVNAPLISIGQKPVSELGVSAPDNQTLEIRLARPCPYFLALTASINFAPCNREFCTSCGASYATSPETVLSCGPYVLDRFEPLATQIHYTKNPNYYNADEIKVESISAQVVANTQQAMMCYQANDIDITAVSGEYLELADGDSHLHTFSTASSFSLELNFTNEALKSLNIRLALAKSIDRDSIVKNVLRAGSFPLYRINPSGYYFETDGTDFAADPHQYDEYTGYDPAKAKEYWNKGLSEIGKSSVELELVYTNSMSSVAEALKAQMEKNLPGLTLKLKIITTKEFTSMKGEGGYDLFVNGWVGDYADPTTFYMQYVSGSGAVSFSDPKYDEAYQDCQSDDVATDPDERNKRLHKAEDILMQNVAVIPVFSQGRVCLIADGVEGLQYVPTGVSMILTGLKKEVK